MIKSNLRCTMNDDRLSALLILSTESTFKNLILKISLLILLRRKLEKFSFETVCLIHVFTINLSFIFDVNLKTLRLLSQAI